MTEMGDAFRSHREYERKKRSDRASKLDRAFGPIRTEAAAMGVSISQGGPDCSWEFYHDGDLLVRWWPGSGKTSDGAYFRGWPDIKKRLAGLVKTRL